MVLTVLARCNPNLEAAQFNESVAPSQKKKRTPLIAAAAAGHAEIVKRLLAARADVEQGKSDDGVSTSSTCSELHLVLRLVPALLLCLFVFFASDECTHVSRSRGLPHREVTDGFLVAKGAS